jgi:DNA invertase Pin-like site-specific DNA recombinase
MCVRGVRARYDRERVNAGLARAKAKGVTLGRPKIDDKAEQAVRKALVKGDKDKHKLAAKLGAWSRFIGRRTLATEMRSAMERRNSYHGPSAFG